MLKASYKSNEFFIHDHIHLNQLIYLFPSCSLISVISLNDFPPSGNPSSDASLFGAVNVVQCGEVRQYLYCLQPRAEARLDSRTLRGESNIGKLDLVWRTSLGDRGRLQTSQLQRMVYLPL